MRKYLIIPLIILSTTFVNAQSKTISLKQKTVRSIVINPKINKIKSIDIQLVNNKTCIGNKIIFFIVTKLFSKKEKTLSE